MRIAKRHLEILMPEQILDRSQVHAAHDEMRCEGMAEVVESEISKFGPLQGRVEGCFDVLDSCPLVLFDGRWAADQTRHPMDG